MDYFELQDCSGGQPNVWTDSDLGSYLTGIQLGSVFYSQEFPGVAWEVVTVQQTDPGGAITITPVGPIFTSCAEAQANALQGCTDPTACTEDDGSCFYNNVTIRILCNQPITSC